MPFTLQTLKKLTLLLVEDDIVVREQTSEMLGIFFDRVLVASNGEDAFVMLAKEKIDIVLSDIKMPRMDGLTLVKKLRLLNNQVPFILLSSFSDQNVLLEAANSGIDGYILKPIELDDLMQTFMRVLMRKNVIVREFSFREDIVYNMQTQELYCCGQRVDLGKGERALLQLFIDNSEKTLTKDKIIASLWPNTLVTESALKNVLGRLRKKIGFDLIISVKGSGWRLNTSH